MKLYLAGPMSGYPQHNWPIFREKAAELRAAGYEVIDASECNGPYEDAVAKGYFECLKTDLRAMLTCEAVALLTHWEESKGANIERQLAMQVGMVVKTVEDWLTLQQDEER
jgi:hypothetical protein